MKISFEEWWYRKIFREYSKSSERTHEVLWLYKILNQLRILLEITNNIDLVKNSLVILINLLDNGPLDIYEKLGKDIKYLSTNERKNVKELLKKTLILEKI
jgi:hypothetical protein